MKRHPQGMNKPEMALLLLLLLLLLLMMMIMIMIMMTVVLLRFINVDVYCTVIFIGI
jgi:hypothetical protein